MLAPPWKYEIFRELIEDRISTTHPSAEFTKTRAVRNIFYLKMINWKLVSVFFPNLGNYIYVVASNVIRGLIYCNEGKKLTFLTSWKKIFSTHGSVLRIFPKTLFVLDRKAHLSRTKHETFKHCSNLIILICTLCWTPEVEMYVVTAPDKRVGMEGAEFGLTEGSMLNYYSETYSGPACRYYQKKKTNQAHQKHFYLQSTLVCTKPNHFHNFFWSWGIVTETDVLVYIKTCPKNKI